MPDALVLDASVAIAIVLREAQGDVARPTLVEQARRNATILAPGHFWLEVANVLGRRYRLGTESIVDAVRRLDEFQIRTIDVDRTLWLLALDRMAIFGLSAYDAAYLALAEAMDARLLTFDVRLAVAAGDRALPGGPRRLAEDAAPYGASAPNRVWAEYGQYLAELRRDVLAG